ELIAYQQVDLYAKVTSFVKELNVDIGSEVTAGQLLMTLEAPELTSQLAAAESKLQSLEAIYKASDANYNRLIETSKTPGTVSQNDLDQATAKKNSDFANLDAAKASYKEISVVKSYLEIRAPFNGMITSRNVNLGAYVGPSGKGSELPLLVLQEQKHLRLAISVPEVYTGYLNNGDTIHFKVKALPGQTFKATIKRMAGALDLRLRSEKIEMDVMNDDKKLLPGMVAEVSISLAAKVSSFTVPKTALVNSNEGVFVIRVVKNKAERIEVKKGRDINDKVEIFGMLSLNDTFISKANEEIKNGAYVNAK
ncbi:MAG TPA: efflux RND transporter periplasmic adaptor subunit, partial [Bacteroidia bacterium]|nr:efflux RND transporter periplasmic adaptor subunit [Bacteroidia bacterium]